MCSNSFFHEKLHVARLRECNMQLLGTFCNTPCNTCATRGYMSIKTLANLALERLGKSTNESATPRATLMQQPCNDSMQQNTPKVARKLHEKKPLQHSIATDPDLINWFLSASDLPADQFYLNLSIKVIDPIKFYTALRQDISQGDKNPRAKNGALQSDLKLLRDICQKPNTND